jgi:hypothetical protein
MTFLTTILMVRYRIPKPFVPFLLFALACVLPVVFEQISNRFAATPRSLWFDAAVVLTRGMSTVTQWWRFRLAYLLTFLSLGFLYSSTKVCRARSRVKRNELRVIYGAPPPQAPRQVSVCIRRLAALAGYGSAEG